jgi:hypothetical protein
VGELVQLVRFKLLAMHRGVSAQDLSPIRIMTAATLIWRMEPSRCSYSKLIDEA